MNAREEALLQALDKVVSHIQALGESVGEVIAAINTPTGAVMPDATDYESLRKETCTVCHRPAYPHPYRHPVSVRVHPQPNPVVAGEYASRNKPPAAGMSSLGQIMDEMRRDGQLPFPEQRT